MAVLLLINLNTIKAKAVTVNYDAAAAVAFSYNHVYSDSSWECAEYVSRCLIAGGVNMSVQKGVKGLYQTLSNFDNFEAYDIPYKAGDSYFYATGNNAGKIAVGDVIIIRGNGGSPYLHAVIVSKIDSKGIVYFNAHNFAAQDGAKLPTYSTVFKETGVPYSGKRGEVTFTCFHYKGSASDTTPPSVTNVHFSEQDNSHFKITYTLSDNIKVVKEQIIIYCPHTTLVKTYNDSDNGTWSMSFNWKDMPDGNYYCTVTAWDAAGNSSTTVTSATITKKTPDTTAPTISNVKVTDVTDTGYTVTCNISDNVGVTKVQFPTWTDSNGQDDLIWHDGVINGNTASYRVNISSHNNERGCYYNTHIYAFDVAGNQTVNTQYIWVPDSTAYLVVYHFEKLNGEYSNTEVINYAISGTVVNPMAPDYPGYSTPAQKSATIKADCSTVIEYYYNRNSHNLTWNFDGGKATGEYTKGSVKYEQSIVAPTVTKEGYKFLGWDKMVPDKMPDNDITITAKWEKDTNTNNSNNNGNSNNNNNGNNNTDNNSNNNNNNGSNNTNNIQNNTNTNNNNTSNNNNNQNNNSVSDFVARFYDTILGRKADESGLNHWTSSLLSGEKTGADVAKGFVLSQEFIAQNNSNAAFVNKMYKAFFDRAADEGGYNNWMNKLENGASREEVLAGFVKSQEFKDLCAVYGITPGELTVPGQTNTQQTQQNNNQSNSQRPPLKLDSSGVDSSKLDEYVERLYLKVLGRNSEPEGKEYWKNAILNGRDDRGNIYDAAIAARKGFFESKEYQLKNRTDDEFLYDLYGAFFNREPDPEGFAYWHDKMKYEGYTRQRVIDEGFGHSQEFKNLLKSYGFRIIE